MIVPSAKMIAEYNQEGPRYTSYPTVPNWKNRLSTASYKKVIKTHLEEPASLYIHIPFCPKRCFFCACNVIVKKLNPEIGNTYVDYLLKEINILTNKKIKLKEIHLGGGTPTYLSDMQLQKLCEAIQTHFDLSEQTEMSIEIDPRTLDISRLATLKKLGFNRLSFGIQDLDQVVQKTVNRKLPLETMTALFQEARRLKFTSINTDVIYGLPNQTRARFKETCETILQLNPDRIALYSFAYLPSIHTHQNGFDPTLLPTPKEKLALFNLARKVFLAHGYIGIAMDHFAKKEDALATAFLEGSMKRNFMGYTPQGTRDYIGLGVSAIGSISGHFIQNVKTLQEYYDAIDLGHAPIHRSHTLSKDDVIRKSLIEALMCQSRIQKQKIHPQFDRYFKKEKKQLDHFESQGLLTQSSDEIMLTELGRFFVRNICMIFDNYLMKKTHRYSKTI